MNAPVPNPPSLFKMECTLSCTFICFQFCVIYKSRNNSSIHRDDIIALLAGIVMGAGKGHTVDLNNPDLAICVEIIKVFLKLFFMKAMKQLPQIYLKLQNIEIDSTLLLVLFTKHKGT